MNFFRQLWLLLWKNVILRKQNKVRIVIEIVSPLFLFLILMWVRTRGLRSNVPDCYLAEKPLPSSGLLPFLRTYICEVNDTCYDYPVNNNYDQIFLNKFLELTFAVTDAASTVVNNNTAQSFVLVYNVANVIIEQRNKATAYTRSLEVKDTTFNKYNFTETIDAQYSQINETIRLAFYSSSPNFNLLYNEKYSHPVTVTNISGIPPAIIDFLYGEDLDSLNRTNNPIDNATWVRSHLCDESLSDRNQLFRVNSDKANFYAELCKLDDTNLVKLVTFTSSSIDFNAVKLKVFFNTDLINFNFWNQILQAVTSLQNILQDVQTVQALITQIGITQQITDLFQNASIPKVLCGESRASIFAFFDQKTIDRILASFLPNNTNTNQTQSNNTTNNNNQSQSNNSNSTTNSTINLGAVVGYLNTLSALNQSQCPVKYSNSSQKGCLCETIFATLNRLPRSVQIIWKQLKPVITGKLLYAPNTSVYSNLIKSVNSTFQTIDEFTQLLGQLDAILQNAEGIKPIVQTIWSNLPANVTAGLNFEEVFTQIKSIQQISSLIVNLVKCVELNKFVGYKNEYEAVDTGMQMIDDESFWAAIIFDDGLTKNTSDTALPDKVKYKIRMTTSWTHNTFFAQDRFYRYGPNICTTCNIDYLYGYIYLQDMIEKAIIEVKTNQTQDFGITTQMSGYPCYVNDKFIGAITRTLPMLMVLAWIYTVSMLVKDIVYEKEKRLKEFMRVMGLSNGTHWTAWFITSFVSMIFICILLAIILKFGKVLTYTDFGVIFVFLVCFTVSTITQCFLISVFFNRANLAAAVGGIVYFLLYLPYTILVNYSETIQPYQQILASLSSTVAFGYGCELMATYELQSVGVNWGNFYKSPFEERGVSMNILCLLMLFDAFLYMLLAWYIENVAPGEFGIARPFYFPFQPSYWFGDTYKKKLKNCGCCWPSSNKNKSTKKLKHTNGVNGMNGHHNKNYDVQEDQDKNAKIGIEIDTMHKIYSRGRNHALKGLSLNFYENEITSFLGHNGAGKSTTMHILTGLYSPSSGTAKINGLDITENMDEIRKSLGFVPQHNVLFDNMTVADHLWFYARLKGLESKATKKELEKMLVDTGLVKKRDELAKNLSGGMQRKLSVAIAFVGGSKTVILDEPSAGVDPNGRRSIWDLLFKYRVGRTIVISTHHMDEADILGDRIAIIANGRLVCHGTALYLKHKYGRGYYLTIVKKEMANETSTDLNDDLNEITLKNSQQPLISNTPVDYLAGDSASSDSLLDGSDDTNEERDQIRNETELLGSLTKRQDVMINKFIKSRISNAILFENIGNEMTYTISNKPEYTKYYKEFFENIEANMDYLGIDGITISDTTLEEIFVKLAKQPETITKSRMCNCCSCTELSWSCIKDKLKLFCRNKEQISADKSDSSRTESFEMSQSDKALMKRKNSVNVSPDTLKAYALYTKYRVSKYKLPLQQLYGLLAKRFHRVKRNIKGFIAEIVLPIVFVCLALLVSTLIPPVLPRPPLEIHPWLYDNNPNYIYFSQSSRFNSSNLTIPLDVKKVTDTFFDKPSLGTRCMKNHTIAINSYTDTYTSNKVVKELKCLDNGYTYSNASTSLPTNIANALFSTNYSNTKVSPACSCTTGFPVCPDGAGGDIEYRTQYKLQTEDILLDLTGRNITDWQIKTELNNVYFRKRFGGFEFMEPSFNDQSVDNFYNSLNRILRLLNTNSSVPQARELLTRNAIISNNRVKVWYNNKGYYAHVGFLNTINNAILRAKLKDINASVDPRDYGIVSVNHPMNFTDGDLVSQLTQQIFIDLFVAICIIFALSFIPASFLVFLVEEREANCKQLQFVSGVKPYIYWISNYLWDLINFVVPCFLCVIVFVAFDVETYMSKENFPCLIALMMLYGWACIPLMYPLNYIFQIPSSAFVLSSCLNVFIGVISTMTTSILEQLAEDEPDLYDINEILKPVFIILFPHYCLGRGFLDMSIQYNTARAQRTLGFKDYTFNPFKFELVGRNLVALAVQGAVFFTLNLLIEYKFFIRIKPAKVPKSELASTTDDADVENERKRMLEIMKKNERLTRKQQQSENGRQDYIKLENLTKVYRKFSKCHLKKHVAVKSLCLGINKGECFGLIGVNGAGKTTTFKMLTGEIPITAGDAKVNGFSVSKEIENVHRNIGYCPQQDAIFSLLTAREHLLFYARLRGVPEEHAEKVAIWALNRVGLNVFADRMAADFSGGNKRKLATAIALVGDPTVIALDEPTSGMDAKARRLLWNDILSLIKEDRIVILTSHSMEECEALCTRLVIMVNGEFKCLGSPQHLKLKYGNGYKLAIRLNSETEHENLLNFMKINFPTSILNEVHKNLIEFTLPFADNKLSKIFGTIEKNRLNLDIKDYTVSQTTLDQIFVDFAKAQEEEGIETTQTHIYNTNEYVVPSDYFDRTNHLANGNINNNTHMDNQHLTLNVREETTLPYESITDDNPMIITQF